MRFKTIGSTAAMILAVLAAVSCASTTKWVSTWVEPAAAGGQPLKKILVVGMSADMANRRMFEDSLVVSLQGYKIEATPSFRVLPEGKISEDEFRAKVKEGGYDGVIITRLVDVREKTEYVPPTASVGVSYGGWGPYWSGYGGWYSTVYSPGYMINTTVVRLQTRLWSTAGDGKPIWTGVSDSADPREIGTLSKEVSFMVVRDLSRNGLI